jgi:signal transduction histidine kinase
MNLISNAVKYNDKERIVINIQTESYQKKMVAQFVEVSVSDNGPGIPQEEQGEIFSLFKRGDHGKQKKERDRRLFLSVSSEYFALFC